MPRVLTSSFSQKFDTPLRKCKSPLKKRPELTTKKKRRVDTKKKKKKKKKKLKKRYQSPRVFFETISLHARVRSASRSRKKKRAVFVTL